MIDRSSTIVKNYEAYLRYLPRHATAMKVFNCDGLTLIDSGIKSAGFNHVVGNLEVADAKDTVLQIKNYFSEHQLPLMWWVHDDTRPDNLEDYLFEAGFEAYEHDVGMYRILLDSDKANDSSLNLQRVTTDTQLKQFLEVAMSEEEIDLNVCLHYYQQCSAILFSTESALQYFLLMLDDKPIATAALFFEEETVGVYQVTVLPEYRRQSYAMRMLQVLLAKAHQQGSQVAVLLASELGQALYEKLGFELINQFYVFEA